MIEQFEQLENKLADVERQLADPNIISKQVEYKKLLKHHKHNVKDAFRKQQHILRTKHYVTHFEDIVNARKATLSCLQNA